MVERLETNKISPRERISMRLNKVADGLDQLAGKKVNNETTAVLAFSAAAVPIVVGLVAFQIKRNNLDGAKELLGQLSDYASSMEEYRASVRAIEMQIGLTEEKIVILEKMQVLATSVIGQAAAAAGLSFLNEKIHPAGETPVSTFVLPKAANLCRAISQKLSDNK